MVTLYCKEAVLEAAGPEALELGLLMTEEQDITSEDDEELYSFQHKLIHEFVAAQYIAGKMTNTDFLKKNFVKSRDVENHIEVVCFCIDMASSNAKEVQYLVKYLTGKYAQKAGRLMELGELGINEIYEWQNALVPMVQAFNGSQEQKERQFIQATSIYIDTPLFSPEYVLYISQSQKGEEEENVLIVENHGSKSEDPFWLGYLKKMYPKLLAGLHRLDLSRCEISKLSVKSLIPDLSLMPLKSCNFAKSLLRTGLELITEAIKAGSLKTVECFDFSDCEIPASALINFICQINLCPNIRVVNLNGNAFTDIDLELDVTCCPISIESRSSYSKGSEVSAESNNTSQTTSTQHRLQDVLLQRIASSEHILLYSHETDAEDLAAVVQHCKSIILSNITRHKMDETNDYHYFVQQTHNSRCVRHLTCAIARYDLLMTRKIEFSNTRCGTDELKSLFSVLHKCNHQKDLILIGLNLYLDIFVALPESLGVANLFPGLDILDISGKDISNSLHLLTEHVHTSLVKLNISRCNLIRADIEALAIAIEAGRFPRLQEIQAEGYDTIIQFLPQSLRIVHLLPGLEELNISGKNIGHSLHLLTEHVQTKLVKLDVSRCDLKRADIEELVLAIEAGRFPNLQDVDVMGNDLSQSLHLVHRVPGFREKLNVDTIKLFLPQSLCFVHLLPGLEELYISGRDISNSLHLLTEHVQTSLVKLHVSKCNLTRPDIEALATGIEAGRFPKLMQVNVMGNDLSQSLHLVHLLPGFTERLNLHSIRQYLPQSLCLVHLLPGLEELDVSGEDIGNSLHLLTEHVQTSLVKVNVSECNLTRADIEALAIAVEAGRLPNLQDVNVMGNDLSQSLHLVHRVPGIKDLVVSEKDTSNSLHLFTEHVQTSLVKLNVSECNLTRAGIEALAEAIEAGRFPKLQDVDVMGNDLSQSLHLVHVLPGLEELDVSGKDISNSLRLLTEHVQTSLVKLNIRRCNLTRADKEALGIALGAGRFPKLQKIDITRNNISNSLHLLTEHVQTSLVKLIMKRCNLTAADISALAVGITAGRLPRLQRIDLQYNDLDDDSVQPLCEALLQCERPEQSMQGKSYRMRRLIVLLRNNKLSAKFVKQWKKKLKRKLNVHVVWSL